MSKWIFVALVTMLPFCVKADGRADHVKVKYVRVDANGKGYVRFYSNLTHTPPSCGNNYPAALSFDTNTAGGQAILSLALTAHSNGKKIQAYGSGNCSIYGSVENWSWGFIVNDLKTE